MSSHLRKIGSVGRRASGTIPAHAVDVSPASYSNYSFDVPDESRGVDILRLFLYVIQYRWLLASLIAIGLVSAFAATMMMTPQYRASARLEILVPSAKVFQDMELTSESTDVRAFQTASEKIRSRAVAERAVFNLGLSEQVDFLFPQSNFSPFNILTRAFGVSRNTPNIADYPPDQRARMAIDRVQRGLVVTLIPNTSLLSVSFSSQNPKYAYEIANQIAQSFIDQRVDQASDTSTQARKFIQEQVIQAKARLQQSEEELVEYAKSAGITIIGNDSSLIMASLTSVNTALDKAVQENLDYGRMVQQIDNGQGASLEPALNSEGLGKLRGRLAELNAEYQQKRGLFKPEFPEMQQLRSQINEIENQIKLGVQAISDSIRIKFTETQAKVTDLRNKLSELEAEQSNYQDKNIQYTILKREVDSNRLQYDSLIAKLNDVSVGSELKSQNASIIDLAILPRSPFAPSLGKNLAVGFILSLALGAIAIYVRELINNTFADPGQVEKELQLPLLGIIPHIEEAEFSRSILDPQSGLSEAYRSLRTSLQFSGEQGAPHVLAVTSSEPSEGKSTTIFKLAEDFSALGAKVLVIDGDMRRPTLHRAFKVDNALGLSNVLTSTIRRSDVPMLIKQVKPSLSLITAGTIPPNPADLLSSSKMGVLLQKLGQNYDIVLIDSPPVIGLSDALILSRMAEATLLVVSTNQVARKAANAALKRLRGAGGNIVGATLTKFTVRRLDYNYAYKYLNYNYSQYADDMNKLEGKPNVKEASLGANAKIWSFSSANRYVRQHLSHFVNRIRSQS